jgi:hypothetical protein
VKKIITDRQLSLDKAPAIPRLYGLAYRNFALSQTIYYPIPLNLIIRYLRLLQKLYRQGFAAGQRSTGDELRAYRQGYLAALDKLEQELKGKLRDDN